MSHKGSCGHIVDSLDDLYALSIKDAYCDFATNSFQPCLSVVSVCSKCYDWYLVRNLVLLTKEDEDSYCRGEGFPHYTF